jgi:hypothetical protein
LQGVPGEQGVQGEAGADALWNFTGAWVNGVDYAAGDVVEFNGSSYYTATGVFSSYSPPGYGWTLVASKGDTGEAGADGADGIDGIDGADASFTVSETPPENPQLADVWYSSVNGRQFIYYDNYWVESTTAIVGQTGGTSGIIDGGTATSVYEV